MTQINNHYNHSVLMSAIATEALQSLISDMPKEQVAEVISKATAKVMMDILSKRFQVCNAAEMISDATDELVKGLERVQAVAGRRVM